jgi:hypothetical protein
VSLSRAGIPVWWLCTKVLGSEAAALSRLRPMYLGNPAALEVVQSKRRHRAVVRSGNATFSLTYWLLFEAGIVLQQDAIHVF